MNGSRLALVADTARAGPETELENRTDRDDGDHPCHGRLHRKLSQQMTPPKRRESSSAGRTTKLRNICQTDGFVHSGASLQRGKDSGRDKLESIWQDEVPDAADEAWRVTHPSRKLVCGTLLLEKTETYEERASSWKATTRSRTSRCLDAPQH